MKVVWSVQAKESTIEIVVLWDTRREPKTLLDKVE